MKTEIYLPDQLVYLVEKYAAEHGHSRNEICKMAISDFIKRIKKNEMKDITGKINSVCDDVDTNLDSQIRAASKRMLVNAEW